MSTRPLYRERLTPSLWMLAAAIALVPMVTLVFVRVEPTIALGIGVAVGFAVIALLIALSPVVEVSGGELRAGRAHIPVRFLADPKPFTREEARAARGQNLDARAWHLIRGGIDGVVTVAVTDPVDPTPVWVVSSRTPDRLAAAIRAASVQAAHSRQIGPSAVS
ncbi:DUF3093 domain-containing protein [Microbacterium gorillae]|uniref:DUF3093 domain-containing protein n=1 Tax=Microbacterium gorillae TaxID=1231063 RepID=UPI001E389851|nr:DUF3093 domain-containing protein [Microbacterium gorillae]